LTVFIFYSVLEEKFDEDDESIYLKHVQESHIYNHPQCIDLLANHFHIDHKESTFYRR